MLRTVPQQGADVADMANVFCLDKRDKNLAKHTDFFMIRHSAQMPRDNQTGCEITPPQPPPPVPFKPQTIPQNETDPRTWYLKTCHATSAASPPPLTTKEDSRPEDMPSLDMPTHVGHVGRTI